ncbi:MAG: transposase [Phycisphaerae bacterium]
MSPRRRDISVRELRTCGESRAVRLPEFDYAGDAKIHITICAARGAPFRDTRVAQMICTSVEKSCELRGYRLFGYCLMPEHLHVLLSPVGSGVPLGDWLQSFKGYTTSQYMRWGARPPLWQRSGHDHVCRVDETAEKVLTYIVNNPVRTELVQCWRDWRWTRAFIEI